MFSVRSVLLAAVAGATGVLAQGTGQGALSAASLFPKDAWLIFSKEPGTTPDLARAVSTTPTLISSLPFRGSSTTHTLAPLPTRT
jgi:hypothetical protein